MRLQCNLQKGNPKVLKGSPKNCRRDCRCLQQNQFELILLRKTLQENVRNVTTIFSNVFALELSNVSMHSNVFLQNKELQRFYMATLQKLSGNEIFKIALQPRKKTHQCSRCFKVRKNTEFSQNLSRKS